MQLAATSRPSESQVFWPTETRPIAGGDESENMQPDEQALLARTDGTQIDAGRRPGRVGDLEGAGAKSFAEFWWPVPIKIAGPEPQNYFAFRHLNH